MFPKIALLTPYGGTNLGDQAIQFSFVDNLRAQCRGAELIGLTLDPARTAEIHGIPCYPITALEVEFYSSGLFQEKPALPGAGMAGVAAAAPLPEPPASVLRVWLRSFKPLVGFVHAARRGVRHAKSFCRELRFVVSAWKLTGELSLLIVAGGGQIDDEWGGAWGHPYALMRWAVLARLRGVPVAFASVGTCQLASPLSRAFTWVAMRAARFRSYRDQGSKTALQRWSFTHSDPCFPDAAFGFRRSEDSPAADADLIGVSPIAFGRAESWPTEVEPVYRRYINALADFMIAICDRGFQPVLFTTSGADRDAIRDLLARISVTHPALAASLDVKQTRDTHTLAHLLPRLRAVVASRLHGVILSHLWRVPVLAISFDRKVDAHMNDMGLLDYRLDIRSLETSGLDRVFTTLMQHEAQLREVIDARVIERAGRLNEQFSLLGRLAESRLTIGRVVEE